ncbi:MAG TPA: hypothetical protein VI968_02470 [archaeon]|nr:hypothetical protein [archaeon]
MNVADYLKMSIPEECEVDTLRNPIRYIEGSGRLGTYGVASCWVTMLYACNDMKRGILTHCAAERGYWQSQALAQMLQAHPQMKTSPVRKAIIFIGNACRFVDEITEAETLYARNMRLLKDTVRTEFDADLQIIKYPSSFIDVITTDEMNEIILSFDDSSWSAWFGSGKFEL